MLSVGHRREAGKARGVWRHQSSRSLSPHPSSPHPADHGACPSMTPSTTQLSSPRLTVRLPLILPSMPQ
jgi:hypothetical protein